MNLLVGEQSMPLFGSLLPQSEIEERLEDRLIARQLILRRTVEACRAVLERRLTALDPSAGDQACQIRALNFSLAFRAKNFGQFNILLENCEKSLEDIAGIRKNFIALELLRDQEIACIRTRDLAPLIEENKKANEAMAKAVEGIDKKSAPAIREPFVKFFKELNSKKAPHEERIAFLQVQCENAKKLLLANIDFQVSQVALTVIQSYLLTMTRDQILEQTPEEFHYHEHVSVRKLEYPSFPFPSRLISGIVEVAKAKLSQSSIDFVQCQANQLRVADGALIRRMVGRCRVNPKKNRGELPFYYLTRVIFDRALDLKVPILLKVRNVKSHPLEERSFVGQMLFVPVDGKYEMVLKGSSKSIEGEAIIIYAFSRCSSEELANVEFQRKLIGIAGGIQRLIELNTAQHTQFTDQSPKDQNLLEAIPDLEQSELEKLNDLKREAVDKGFSNSNPALCCIDHIHCDRVNLPIEE